MPTWLINGQSPAALGLALPAITYGSMVPDTLTLDHLTAAWDADPVFAYGQQVVITRDGVTVFVGKVRTFPRFAGPNAETTSYTIAGPWDWLQRRALLQNQAIVANPATSTIPAFYPQGLAILGQSDAGTSVQVSASLAGIIAQAIAAGVPILLGTITGFGYATAWDEVADLTVADGIVRLLGSAPDAVVYWDYTTTSGGQPRPTIHIGRRANLSATSLAIAPAGSAVASFGGTYAEFESIKLTSRPDLVVPGVFLTYRRVNTFNGRNYLGLEGQGAVGSLSAQPTDENAIVRTIELAGSSFSETVLEQECKTLPLAGALTASGTITSGSNFTELVKFWKRKVPALAAPDVVIKGFKDCGRSAAPVADADGEETTPALDTSLVRELIEGAITPWMRDTTLNRKAQEQNYTARIAYSIKGVDQKDADGFGIVFSAGVLATNASTRTYTWQESASATPAEPTPAGLAAALYTAMAELQHEGSFTLVEVDCTLAIRPGQVVNLTGGRAEWATMRAVVQQVAADLTTGKTTVQVGFPTQLGPADLVEIYRANRFKKSATRGLIRATGKL